MLEWIQKLRKLIFSHSICLRCLKSYETNAHVYCCTAPDAVKQRKDDWIELWKQLRRSNTAAIIEATWRHYLSPIVDIPLGNSIVDSFPIVHGELSDLLQQAIQEQEIIGWEKLLVGMGTVVWKTIQDLFDHDNPKPPKRSATRRYTVRHGRNNEPSLYNKLENRLLKYIEIHQSWHIIFVLYSKSH
mmetsp:Transcript_9813/g.14197  ORF Transcript_9813/g.14197 Transcript_9813/m.14197 type:complete len:187 (-) Transcript_9813:1220-1780(-)